MSEYDGTNYEFHSDPGHGWLRVHLSELVILGIARAISNYSYLRNGIAYLEEDSDAPKFIAAKKAKGEEVKFTEIHKENTPIRRYPPYNR